MKEFQSVADQRWLLYAPPEKQAMFAQLPLAIHWSLQPQASGDLGERLGAFFQTAFAAGARRAVAIGSDCPALSAALGEEAFRSLDRNDAVMGPATDGGYYLIGLSRPEISIFKHIAWSTAVARQQTLQRIASLGLSCHHLVELTDLDEVESLPQIEAELQRLDSPIARKLSDSLKAYLLPSDKESPSS